MDGRTTDLIVVILASCGPVPTGEAVRAPGGHSLLLDEPAAPIRCVVVTAGLALHLPRARKRQGQTRGGRVPSAAGEAGQSRFSQDSACGALLGSR